VKRLYWVIYLPLGGDYTVLQVEADSETGAIARALETFQRPLHEAQLWTVPVANTMFYEVAFKIRPVVVP
jgi:hypothetical protein